jgi:SAM-dependent methyltransferase
MDRVRPVPQYNRHLRGAHAAIAAHYDREWAGPSPGQPYRAFWRLRPSARDAVDAHLGPLRGRRVLELAIGSGAATLRLAGRGATVIAVELSAGGLRALESRAAEVGLAPKLAPVNADAERLPIAPASVDLVYGENFLMYVDPAAIGREAARVLKPGGRAIFLEPTAHHLLVRLYRRLGSPYRDTSPRYFALDDLPRLGAPFATLTHQEHYLLSVLALPLAAHPLLFALAFRPLDLLDRCLYRLFPALRHFCWLTVIALESPR